MEASLASLPILMYHHIDSPPPSVKIRGLYVTPQQLDWQIRRLKQAGFVFTNFQRLSQQTASASSALPRQIILTFDDGYQDNYQNAFPILQRHEVTAVIYPVVGAIGKSQVVLEENEEQIPVDLLSAKEIKAMSQAGIEFGSHLWDHVHLTRLNETEMLEQLSQSKNALEAIVEKPVVSVAYPFGAYNDQVIKIATQVGYHYGVTTYQGTNAPPQSWMELQRFTVKGHKFYHRWLFLKTLRGLL